MVGEALPLEDNGIWTREEGDVAHCSLRSITGTGSTQALLCQHFSTLAWNGASIMRENHSTTPILFICRRKTIKGIHSFSVMVLFCYVST